MVEIFSKKFKSKIKKGMDRGGLEFIINLEKGVSICWLLISGMFWFFLIHGFSMVFFQWVLNLIGPINEAYSVNTFLGLVSVIYFAHLIMRVLTIILRKEDCETCKECRR